MVLLKPYTSIPLLVISFLQTQSFLCPSRSFWRSGLASSRHVEASLCMSYQKVFVAGGSSGVGKEIVQKLVEAGKEVVAIVRRKDAFDELSGIKGVKPMLVDALDLKGVEGALDGCDAAITTLGGSSSKGDEFQVDYEGNRNVIESSGILGITRIILVTSIGCGNSRGSISDETYAALEKPLVEKTKAERMLQKYYTNSAWTIIRPGGLKTADETGKAIVTENNLAAGLIGRKDVAKLVLKVLDNESTFRRVFTAIDPSIQSSFSTSGYAEFPL